MKATPKKYLKTVCAATILLTSLASPTSHAQNPPPPEYQTSNPWKEKMLQKHQQKKAEILQKSAAKRSQIQQKLDANPQLSSEQKTQYLSKFDTKLQERMTAWETNFQKNQETIQTILQNPNLSKEEKNAALQKIRAETQTKHKRLKEIKPQKLKEAKSVSEQY